MKFSLLLSLIFIQQTLTHQEILNSNKCDEGKFQDINAKLDKILYELNLIAPPADNFTSVDGNFNAHEIVTKKVTAIKYQHLPTSCAEALQQCGQKSGIHQIYLPDSKLEPFYVYCLADPEQPQAPWTIIQRRQDGSVNFFRKWADYRYGFGNIEGEYFIGLDILHALTQTTIHELWIKMEDFDKQTRSANYSSFAIGDNSQAYALNLLGSFKGDGGDSMTKIHAGQKFSTTDKDNDNKNGGNCAYDLKGAWWYNNCHQSNLNGEYLRGQRRSNGFAKGIVWRTWRGYDYSLKYVHMAIRPVQKNKKC